MGGYNRMGGYGGQMDGMQGAPYGSSTLARLGSFVEGFGRFSSLLDANCDALYATLSSILRMFDCMGHLRREMFYIVQSVAMIGILRKIVSWIRFGRAIAPQAAQSLTPGRFADDISSAGMEAFGSTAIASSANIQSRLSAWPLRLLVVISVLVGGPILLIRVISLLLKLMGYGDRKLPGSSLFEDPNVANMANLGEGERAMLQDGEALVAFDFRGATPDELNMQSGDKIRILAAPFEGWFEAEISGRRGLVPTNHLKPVSPKPALGKPGMDAADRKAYVQQRNAKMSANSEWSADQYHKGFST